MIQRCNTFWTIFISFQSHVGIFRQGLKMETTQQEVVEIERINGQPILGSFQCPKVRKTGEIALISPDQVVDQLCLIHDCANGKCAFKESEITIMVEREKVTRVKFTYVHDREHNFYLINKFYLGESLKYFNFAWNLSPGPRGIFYLKYMSRTTGVFYQHLLT